MQPLQQAAAG